MSQPTLTPAAFAQKWRGVTTTEKAASQEHFIDLCRMLGEPTPHDADPTGAQYAFERRVEKAGGGDGFADVWKRGFFAWEYKGKRKDLKAAYQQPAWLSNAHVELDLAVCDAYGWSGNGSNADILASLLDRNAAHSRGLPMAAGQKKASVSARSLKAIDLR